MITTIQGTEIELDLSLEPRLPSQLEKPYYYKAADDNWKPAYLRKGLFQDSLIWAVTKERNSSLSKDRIKHEALTGNIYHPNYLTYLEHCYANHWAPVLTPDILWFTCLNEIASIVRDNAEALRDLFTFAKEGKTEIIVPTGNPVVIPVHAIVQALREYVPVGVDGFLPEFTTSTPSSRLAFAAAFCDVVSPYYSYGMLMCGFPRVIIQGSCDDYIKVAESWSNLPPKLAKVAGKYYANVLTLLEDITVRLEGFEAESSRAFWKDMFKAVKCGSGSQTEVSGWFTKLFRNGAGDGPRYASNFAPHAAKVDYKLLDTGQTFTMLQGVFSSTLGEHAVAVPDFGSIVFETT